MTRLSNEESCTDESQGASNESIPVPSGLNSTVCCLPSLISNISLDSDSWASPFASNNRTFPTLILVTATQGSCFPALHHRFKLSLLCRPWCNENDPGSNGPWESRGTGLYCPSDPSSQMLSQAITSCTCSTTKSFSDRRIDGKFALELELGSRAGRGLCGIFLCSRISSQRSIRSRYVGWSTAKNSIGAYPSRMCARTFEVTASWNVRLNLSSDEPDLLRSTTGEWKTSCDRRLGPARDASRIWRWTDEKSLEPSPLTWSTDSKKLTLHPGCS